MINHDTLWSKTASQFHGVDEVRWPDDQHFQAITAAGPDPSLEPKPTRPVADPVKKVGRADIA